MQVPTGTTQRVDVLTKATRQPAMSDAGPNRNYTMTMTMTMTMK